MNDLSYITSARMPTEKAHGVSIAHMCASFAEAGKDVLLIVPDRKNPLQSDVFSYYGVPKNFLMVKIAAPDFVGRGLSWAPFFFLQRIFFLLALGKAKIPSGIVYTREPEIAWKFSKTHQAVFEAHYWPEGFPGWLQARLVRNAALVVCNSRGTEAAAKRHGITRTIVAPNGFDPALFKDAPQRTRKELGLPDGILALYAGSAREGKGADVARAAGVTVITDKKPTDVPAYLISADILVLPNTHAGESAQFTSPIKLFEYLAAGKAIIASDLPPIREILKEGDALFVPPGDARALADAVSSLTKDSALRQKLSECAKTLSGSYTWDMRARLVLDTLADDGKR